MTGIVRRGVLRAFPALDVTARACVLSAAFKAHDDV